MHILRRVDWVHSSHDARVALLCVECLTLIPSVGRPDGEEVALLRVLSRTKEERFALCQRLVGDRYQDLGPYVEVAERLAQGGDQKGALEVLDLVLAATGSLSWTDLHRLNAVLGKLTR